ncbi:(2Fe-2S)-binding protein [Novosphingobium sp. BL-8H]|uniref:(2Fe-2S)-binding protein n=1 Tax=Novosphingobium sp. BL-8H TaxID=3127640 RepID=UPI003756DFF5
MMQLKINDQVHDVDADDETPLLWVIRDNLGMTGTKYGCGIAQCGACSVLVDGTLTRSCVTPVASVAGRNITTIEKIEEDPLGKRVVDAWVRHQVPQCGYCQSGQVIAATALLREAPHAGEAEIEAAMANLCRCGTYNAIRAALHDLAGTAPATAEASVISDGQGGSASPAIALGASAAIAVAAVGAMGKAPAGEA